MTAIGITAIIVAGIVALTWRALVFAEQEDQPELKSCSDVELDHAEKLEQTARDYELRGMPQHAVDAWEHAKAARKRAKR